MELVISSGTNNERYIVETNSILAELDKKLKGLGSQYTTIIQNKNEIIYGDTLFADENLKRYVVKKIRGIVHVAK